MSSNHFIFDYETLGQNVMSCPIIDCAYFIFDWERFESNEPYDFDELVANIKHIKVSVQDQVENYKYKIEKSTLDWWSQQAPEVRANIKPKPTDVSLEEYFNEIMSYLESHEPVKYWWSRANTFDPIITQRIAQDLKQSTRMGKNLPYWLVRDTRTFIDAKTGFAPKMNSFIPAQNSDAWNKKFKAHNCIHDIAADILRLQALVRFENELSLPD